MDGRKYNPVTKACEDWPEGTGSTSGSDTGSDTSSDYPPPS